MVWVGFWACGFGMGQARAAGNFRTAFGPHLGRIWAAFGPPLYVNNVNKTKKNIIIGILNIICSRFM